MNAVMGTLTLSLARFTAHCGAAVRPAESHDARPNAMGCPILEHIDIVGRLSWRKQVAASIVSRLASVVEWRELAGPRRGARASDHRPLARTSRESTTARRDET